MFSYVLLTQYDGKILGPIAKILGYILNGIYWCLDKIGFPNIALAIILFTIVIYLLLMPLTIKQQKFSKLSAKMNPEIQAIQAKYKNKKDQASMAAMNEETQAVYKKYGVSPSGSCIQLIIQMPILLALYRVIYNFPAYVTSVKNIFFQNDFINKLISQKGAFDFIKNADNFSGVVQFSKQFEVADFVAGTASESSINTFIDVLNRASTKEWLNLVDKFPSLSELITNASKTGVFDLFEKANNFFGLNIANPPTYYCKELFSNGGSFGLALLAVMIPILSAVTQWLNTKLMPQQDTNTNNDQANAMAASMKSMNIMMPLISLFFCFTVPLGLGLYWVAGAVVRSIQQVIINKHIDKMDIDQIIAQNEEKLAKKREKMGVPASTLNNSARLSTKAMTGVNDNKKSSGRTAEEREEAIRKSTEYYNKGVKPGSLAAKANMVKQYNEKNNKQ